MLWASFLGVKVPGEGVGGVVGKREKKPVKEQGPASFQRVQTLGRLQGYLDSQKLLVASVILMLSQGKAMGKECAGVRRLLDFQRWENAVSEASTSKMNYLVESGRVKIVADVKQVLQPVKAWSASWVQENTSLLR